MTDKEFKRLSRAQLIDIIYQLQLQIDELNEEKQAPVVTGAFSVKRAKRWDEATSGNRGRFLRENFFCGNFLHRQRVL